MSWVLTAGGAGTSLFNLSRSGSSSECQWRVLINSCGGRDEERERGYKVAAACCVSPGVSIGARSEVRSVNYRPRPRQRLSTERWLSSGEWAELWRAESVRDGDQRRRQRATSIPVCHYRVRLLWKVMWHNWCILCAVVQFLLFCCVLKRIELFW